jgi:hypothetical protein
MSRLASGPAVLPSHPSWIVLDAQPTMLLVHTRSLLTPLLTPCHRRIGGAGPVEGGAVAGRRGGAAGRRAAGVGAAKSGRAARAAPAGAAGSGRRPSSGHTARSKSLLYNLAQLLVTSFAIHPLTLTILAQLCCTVRPAPVVSPVDVPLGGGTLRQRAQLPFRPRPRTATPDPGVLIALLHAAAEHRRRAVLLRPDLTPCCHPLLTLTVHLVSAQRRTRQSSHSHRALTGWVASQVAAGRRGARSGAEPSPETPDRPEPRSGAAPRPSALAATLNGGGAASGASSGAWRQPRLT